MATTAIPTANEAIREAALSLNRTIDRAILRVDGSKLLVDASAVVVAGWVASAERVMARAESGRMISATNEAEHVSSETLMLAWEALKSARNACSC